MLSSLMWFKNLLQCSLISIPSPGVDLIFFFSQNWAERDPSPGGIPQCREGWQKSEAKMPRLKQFQSLWFVVCLCISEPEPAVWQGFGSSDVNLYPALLQGINSWGTGEFSWGARRAHLETSTSFELFELVTIDMYDWWITLKCWLLH